MRGLEMEAEELVVDDMRSGLWKRGVETGARGGRGRDGGGGGGDDGGGLVGPGSAFSPLRQWKLTLFSCTVHEHAYCLSSQLALVLSLSSCMR